MWEKIILSCVTEKFKVGWEKNFKVVWEIKLQVVWENI